MPTKSVVNRGRYGELFAYDETSETFSLESPNSPLRRHSWPPGATSAQSRLSWVCLRIRSSQAALMTQSRQELLCSNVLLNGAH
jgi:hypothetical protein